MGKGKHGPTSRHLSPGLIAAPSWTGLSGQKMAQDHLFGHSAPAMEFRRAPPRGDPHRREARSVPHPPAGHLKRAFCEDLRRIRAARPGKAPEDGPQVLGLQDGTDLSPEHHNEDQGPDRPESPGWPSWSESARGKPIPAERTRGRPCRRAHGWQLVPGTARTT